MLVIAFYELRCEFIFRIDTTSVLVDTIQPTVSSVSPPSGGTYISGQNLDFTVNFSEAVTVTTTGGTPYVPVTLDTGGMVNASYVSGTGTSSLIFRYTVAAGNQDSNGITVGAAITAGGGTIKRHRRKWCRPHLEQC